MSQPGEVEELATLVTAIPPTRWATPEPSSGFLVRGGPHLLGTLPLHLAHQGHNQALQDAPAALPDLLAIAAWLSPEQIDEVDAAIVACD